MTVGLYIIARDEQEHLRALLDSVEGAFDHIALTDTGSTDGTVELFERWCVEHCQPHSVHRFAWCDDFGAARQFAMRRLDTDWRVWADADETIGGACRLRGALDATDTPGVAFPYEYAPGYVQSQLRATRMGAGTWHGRAHEAQTVNGHVAHSAAAVWTQHREGGRYVENDIRVLSAAIADDPTDARSTFYLAQSYRDAGLPNEALRAYDQRVALGGWDQEVFYAMYQAGCLAFTTGGKDWSQRLLAAYEFAPTRAEPLHALAQFFRQTGSYRLALLFAEGGLVHAAPPEGLFVHRWVYDWGLLFELSIAAFYCGDKPRSRRLGEALLLLDLPEPYRAAVERNLRCVVDS